MFITRAVRIDSFNRAGNAPRVQRRGIVFRRTTRPHCAGIHFSLADVAVGTALGYLDHRFTSIDWRTDHPNLLRLHDKLAARPSFIDTSPPKA